ncbi:hypothetical protein EDC27_0114 [Desulfosoma caldarium]|uniref:Secreted protein n=1 Tax=Desulfosoma caldarium TaxID=610254 RepID=A0A3N1VKW9_9BACT|nr:hypothetical protein EDC27_0114 [Desulfosoma caldarium]
MPATSFNFSMICSSCWVTAAVSWLVAAAYWATAAMAWAWPTMPPSGVGLVARGLVDLFHRIELTVDHVRDVPKASHHAVHQFPILADRAHGSTD